MVIGIQCEGSTSRNQEEQLEKKLASFMFMIHKQVGSLVKESWNLWAEQGETEKSSFEAWLHLVALFLGHRVLPGSF